MPPGLQPPLSVGQEIGKYVVGRLLGQGGMGMVFEVRHRQLGTRAAIKILWPECGITPELSARFLTEARAAAHIEHPGVVRVFEYDQLSSGIPFLIMEFVTGQTLGERLAEVAKVPPFRLGLRGLPLLGQLAATLADIHQRSIVHRDLKPGNIMLVPDPAVPGKERIKILDFGIAKVLSAAAVGMDTLAVRTRAGAMLGTPLYMSPEQWAGVEVDEKADVYALGVLSYEVLVGRVAIDADNNVALMFKHASVAPTRLDQIDPTLPAPLVALVARMLMKEKAARPTMAEIDVALRELSATASQRTPAALQQPMTPSPAAPDAQANGHHAGAMRALATPNQTTLRAAEPQSLLPHAAAPSAPAAPSSSAIVSPRGALAGAFVLLGCLSVIAISVYGMQRAPKRSPPPAADPAHSAAVVETPAFKLPAAAVPQPISEPVTPRAPSRNRALRFDGIPPLRNGAEAPRRPSVKPSPSPPPAYVPPTVE